MHDLPLYMLQVLLSSLTSFSTSSMASLTCISSGGPVDSVTWMRNGATITANSSIFTQSQVIINATSSIYHNILTSFSSSNFMMGSFRCVIRDAEGRNESQTFNSSYC